MSLKWAGNVSPLCRLKFAQISLPYPCNPIRRFHCATIPLRYFSQTNEVKIFFFLKKDLNSQEQANHPWSGLAKKQADCWATMLAPSGLPFRACFHTATWWAGISATGKKTQRPLSLLVIGAMINAVAGRESKFPAAQLSPYSQSTDESPWRNLAGGGNESAPDRFPG